MVPEQSMLGKPSSYDNDYDPALLFPISRHEKRNSIGISKHYLPFFGFDIWNHYEVSWLNPKGKPVVALAEIIYSCDSTNIIESKSLKLYFNSLNNTKFSDIATLETIIKTDLVEKLRHTFVEVKIIPLHNFNDQIIHRGLKGIALDDLDIDCDTYSHNVSFLFTENTVVRETLCSDLLKSNCLITNQPDWCSLQISYEGNRINHEGLLRYLISFRNGNEFHEHCIEKIFMTIMERCKPNELTVYGRSNRRGGIDINSFRSSQPIQFTKIPNIRLCRQ